jgi:DNA repair exonuclease SbcCD ATPase subunit
MLEIINLENGFAVQFPFELKDNFRNTFKTAKWNPLHKRWEVGPRSGKRLQQWIDAVQETAKCVEEAKEIEAEMDLADEELERIKRELSQISKSRQEITESFKKVQQSKELLADKKEELAQAKQDLAAEKSALEKEKIELKNFLSSIFNLSAAHQAERDIGRSIKGVGSINRNKFDEAQAAIQDARTKLKNKGFKLEALDYLWHANFNRPDRDHPDFMNKNAWFNLTKIENEE